MAALRVSALLLLSLALCKAETSNTTGDANPSTTSTETATQTTTATPRQFMVSQTISMIVTGAVPKVIQRLTFSLSGDRLAGLGLDVFDGSVAVVADSSAAANDFAQVPSIGSRSPLGSSLGGNRRLRSSSPASAAAAPAAEGHHIAVATSPPSDVGFHSTVSIPDPAPPSDARFRSASGGVAPSPVAAPPPSAPLGFESARVAVPPPAEVATLAYRAELEFAVASHRELLLLLDLLSDVARRRAEVAELLRGALEVYALEMDASSLWISSARVAVAQADAPRAGVSQLPGEDVQATAADAADGTPPHQAAQPDAAGSQPSSDGVFLAVAIGVGAFVLVYAAIAFAAFAWYSRSQAAASEKQQPRDVSEKVHDLSWDVDIEKSTTSAVKVA